MANTALFGGKIRKNSENKKMTVNEAGGTAYKMSHAAALAQMAVTGTFNGTYYVTAEKQLEQMLDFCKKVSPTFIAKLAVYARKHSYMKDTPAFLLAVLVTIDIGLAKRIFPQVIDNGKMLRNFVQILRSGAIGRRSLGTAAKKMVNAWLDSRTDAQIFRDSVGKDPSIMDCVRMSHHAPKTKQRDALYGYLLGWEHSKKDLPQIVKDFEKFKNGKFKDGVTPDIPFQMLTSLELGQAEWQAIAWNARWHMTRMNLNAFLRHKVFEDSNMVKMVAERLKDENEIRNAKAFPYQLFAAYKNISPDMPRKIVEALHDAMEVAVSNVPKIEGHVYVCPDVSGSMSSPATGDRRGSTSKVLCVDVAALVAAAFLRANENCEIIPFNDDVLVLSTRKRFEPRDTVMTTANRIRNLLSGGTAVSAPLNYINRKELPVDLVVMISDNESWRDRGYYYGRGGGRTAMMAEWDKIKKNNKGAKLVCIDIQPNTTTQAQERSDVLNVGGFSDTVFEIISLFHLYGLDAGNWKRIIESQEI